LLVADKQGRFNFDLHSIPDLLHIGILVIDRDFTILFCNHSLAEWSGISREEILGKNLLFEFPHFAEPSLQIRFSQVFDGETPVFLSSRFHPHLIPSRLLDGSLRVQKGSILPLRKDETVYAMLVIEDVTDLVRQVTAFRKMRDRAMQELAEKKKAESALRVANAKLSLFSDVTLLDIRDQLAIARGLNNIIEGSFADTSDQKPMAEKIDRQLATIEQYVSLMLSFEVLGKQEPEWIPLSSVIMKAKNLSQNYHVACGPEIALLEIFAPPLTDYIFANFFENSKMYGKTGCTVSVSFVPQDHSGILIVEDEGCGIPAEKKGFVFQPGLGSKTRFGLYHTREILTITGMSIQETGSPGKGVKFEITLPEGRWRLAEK
jgi:PAS domain S-box-containing protein